MVKFINFTFYLAVLRVQYRCMLSLLSLSFQNRKISITHLEGKFDLYLVLLNNGYKIHMPGSEVNFLNSLLLILWYQLIQLREKERKF